MGSQQTIKKLFAQIIQPVGKAVTSQGFFEIFGNGNYVCVT